MTQSWQEREAARMCNGTYERCSWERETWWRDRAESLQLHYTHVAKGNRALLSYTTDADKGERDIQTPVKPGRYLTRYFADTLTAKQIAFYSSWQTAGKKENGYRDDTVYALCFTASDPKEIVAVYRTGPDSCMSGSKFNCSDDQHPCAVYGAGDLAVAYLRRLTDGKIVARAIVWPEKKVCARIYPTPDVWHRDGFESRDDAVDCQGALLDRLLAEGYGSVYDGNGTLRGARLLKEEHNRGWVMPYLDHGYELNDCGDFWRIAEEGDGDRKADETQGWIPEDREPEYTCEDCGDGMDEDESCSVVSRVRSRGDVDWISLCPRCYDNRTFYCSGIEETCHNDVGHSPVGGNEYCDVYLEEHAYRSDYDNDWYFEEDDPQVEMANGETWSATEFKEHGFTCEVTGERYAMDEESKDYPGVHCDVTEEDIAEWRASQGIGQIDDERNADLLAAD